MLAVLAGNPNCGKSTLFNALTGGKQTVGNLPGVTVDTQNGKLKSNRSILLTDLPGVYSLNPFSSEEKTSCQLLLAGRYDVIVNVADASALRRSLYLTVQLACLGRPMVIALNMADELEPEQTKRCAAALKTCFGVEVIPVSALYGTSTAELSSAITRAKIPRKPYPAGERGKLLRELENHGAAGRDSLFRAYSLLEGQRPIFSEQELALCRRFAQISGADAQLASVSAKYELIDALLEAYEPIRKNALNKQTVAADKVLMSRRFGVLIFVSVIGIVFWFSFSLVGPALSGVAVSTLDALEKGTMHILQRLSAADMLRSFLVGGVFAGIASVAEFLPSVICVLFMLSVLEDCGYLARVACILDVPMSVFGLSGRCAVPLMLSLGCSVTAELAAQTIRSPFQRRVCAAVIPYLPCSARFTVTAMLCRQLFPRAAWCAMALLFLSGILAVALVSAVCAPFSKGDTGGELLMELPVYRFPSAQNILRDVFRKTGEFGGKILLAVVVSSAVVWVLSYFKADFAPAGDIRESLLALIASKASFVFTPLGFSDWRAVCALAAGMLSKEAVTGTLAVVCREGLGSVLSRAGCFSFAVFTALYPPCVSALWAMGRVLKSRLFTVLCFVCQLALSYLAALVCYNIALLWA